MSQDLDGATGWELVEIVRRPDEQKGFVVTDEVVRESSAELRHVRRELNALAAAGVPPDRELGSPMLEELTGTCTGDHRITKFHVLKCKPGHWRMYFIADPLRKRITFLLAVTKKRDKRDAGDFQRCCERLTEFRTSQKPAVCRLDELMGRTTVR